MNISAESLFNVTADSTPTSKQIYPRETRHTKLTSQFVLYKKTTMRMKEAESEAIVLGTTLFLIFIDIDLSILKLDTISDAKQNGDESELSSSYINRFKESWIRII